MRVPQQQCPLTEELYLLLAPFPALLSLPHRKWLKVSIIQLSTVNACLQKMTNVPQIFSAIFRAYPHFPCIYFQLSSHHCMIITQNKLELDFSTKLITSPIEKLKAPLNNIDFSDSRIKPIQLTDYKWMLNWLALTELSRLGKLISHKGIKCNSPCTHNSLVLNVAVAYWMIIEFPWLTSLNGN